MDNERQGEPLDWRGETGIVVDWPFEPDKIAQDAPRLYYQFIKDHLYKNFQPNKK